MWLIFSASFSSLRGAIGERVVAYFVGLGRIEGKIVRRAQTWFAVDIMATPRKLEKLAEKINHMVASEALSG